MLVDLKMGKLTHQDLGQMQMYVNFFDRFQREEHEAKTIGIVLCSDKNDAMVRITLPDDNEQVLAARYQMCLPATAEGTMKKAVESRVAAVTEQKRRRHYGHAAELVATCVACDKTDETKRWAAALQAEYKRFPALRDEFERALRAP